ncbi:mucoidy inhibitor MuiA family protein [Pinibacter soli]|uniref:Mucoidy inhibitor MuiA family protein n=1 Tax=Pinibacter soli TaxID=3044211 RepID=A0ABT6R6M0_9BACT|nr:mucoidy inhibitor MuiA family protein [Pinibacter soli]MDI3318207.1 mucoidy inhibitor MuiA family protein [Pinibacter soli]
MKKKMLGWMLVAFAFTAKAEDKVTVTATLKTVTIYRSGAEMNHIASATLKPGNNELIIDNISNKIDINSIQVKAPAAVTIMGVEFSNNYLVSTEKTPRIKMLEDSIETVRNKISRIDLAISNTGKLIDVLNANRDIKGAQTGLSVAELMKLMDYYKAKLNELQDDLLQQNARKEKEQELISKLQSQLREEQNKNVATSGRLILQLSVATAGKFDFNISYIAQNAFWTPYYDIRVESTDRPLKVVQKAKINQSTGIDWKQVKLSLSTSMPNQWGDAPILTQWFLGYINPVVVMDKKLSAPSAMNSISGWKEESAVGAASSIRVRGSATIQKDIKPLYVVNGNIMDANDAAKIDPSSIKNIEVLKDEAAMALYGSRATNGAILITLKSGLEDYVSVADNTMDVTFDISIPFDVPTNGKEQTATIQSLEVPANYKHYSVPKLDKDAYLLAQVKGWEKLNLLPGNANIIFEGTYVGKSFIDPNSVQDTLNLTLGRDKRIAIKRDKLIDYSSVKFLGSNKLQKFTYEITVKNNKNEATKVLLKDQFPTSTNKEIEVELLDAGGAEINKDLGVLNWQLQLAANETRKVRFTYSVKYPKDRTVNL